jgi:hypothetical protein
MKKIAQPKPKAKAKAPKLPMLVGPANIVETFTTMAVGMALVSAINRMTQALKEADPVKRRKAHKQLEKLGK